MANTVPYSRIDRFLHSLAFGSEVLQDIMIDLERMLASRTSHDTTQQTPIFVASLPRAGTTILLEVLYRLPGMATHTYRNMPFILTPLLWSKISGSFRKNSVLRERAHGDGLHVNEDSPEAFEEVIWKRFFPHKYKENGIELWTEKDITPSFCQYFQSHMDNMVSLLPDGEVNRGMYLSKNNGNICRLEFLKKVFPGSRLVIPFRDPIEHSISLLRQHQNFLSQHTEEPFIEKYMSDIGHFEFGNLHRPIKFPGMDEARKKYSLNSIDYWASYWCCAFNYLLTVPDVIFISYESFALSGKDAIALLADLLYLDANDSQIENGAALLRSPPKKRAGDVAIEPNILAQAMEIHDALKQRCVLAENLQFNAQQLQHQ